MAVEPDGVSFFSAVPGGDAQGPVLVLRGEMDVAVGAVVAAAAQQLWPAVLLDPQTQNSQGVPRGSGVPGGHSSPAMAGNGPDDGQAAREVSPHAVRVPAGGGAGAGAAAPAEALAGASAGAAAARRHLLRVDLSAVSFIDVSGLGTLCHLDDQARAGGARVQLVGVGAATQRLIIWCGLASRWATSEGQAQDG